MWIVKGNDSSCPAAKKAKVAKATTMEVTAKVGIFVFVMYCYKMYVVCILHCNLNDNI